jgi:monoamine oxidase
VRRACGHYESLNAGSPPASMAMCLATPVGAIAEKRNGLTITTPAGDVSARAVILTVPTNVVAGTSIDLPSTLDPWRDAASRLPLGSNEKLFLQLDGETPFLPETHLIGNPYDSRTCDFYIRVRLGGDRVLSRWR